MSVAVVGVVRILDSHEPDLTALAGQAQAAGSRDEPRIVALVTAAQTGDREAFGELVRLNQRVVFRTALAALGNREDADDAAQEALVVAWQKLPAFRGDASFRTWLLTIVWRKALDRRRSRLAWWRRTDRPAANAVDDGLADVPADTASPEDRAIGRNLSRRIRTAIARLSPKLKDAFLLAMTGEHTYEEIAAMLHVPVGTIKWRVSEARRVIRERLGA